MYLQFTEYGMSVGLPWKPRGLLVSPAGAWREEACLWVPPLAQFADIVLGWHSLKNILLSFWCLQTVFNVEKLPLTLRKEAYKMPDPALL